MQQLVNKSLEFNNINLAKELFGPFDSHLQVLAGMMGIDVQSRGTQVVLKAADKKRVDLAAHCLIQLYDLLRMGHVLTEQDVECAVKMCLQDPGLDLTELFVKQACVVSPKKTIVPKTIGQKRYLEAIREKALVFAIGPAGTGKTYLAVALAVDFLLTQRVKRLILTRPAIEAGERLGFLPGDIAEKVNPYLRPLYDALHDMLALQKVQEMMESGVIEVAPLAFMRGRTLNEAFIILDEAQNTTPEQMKMFLTRIGFGSKALVTGDITQIDLADKKSSGLIQAQEVLAGIREIEFVYFGQEDVVRHHLVGKIIKAYAQYEE